MSFTPEQRRHISTEITSQLTQLKKQIDVEILSDIQKLRSEIGTMVSIKIAELNRDIDNVDKRIRTVTKNVADVQMDVGVISSNIDSKINAMNGQLVVTNERQLAVTKAATKEIILAVGQKIATDVYDKVLDEINISIVPKVNSMVSWVNYQTQDTSEVITDYRRAVERTSSSGKSTITDGNDKHIITPHFRMAFTDDHSDI